MNEPTSDETLAYRVVGSNDSAAVVELLDRYEPFVESLATKYGVYTAYDRDDVRQDCVEVLYESAQAVVDGTSPSFVQAFTSRARNHVTEESSKYRSASAAALPRKTSARVLAALRKFDGDAGRARRYLATEAPASERVDPATFDSVWFLLYGKNVRWDDTPDGQPGTTFSEITADPRSASSLSTVEDRATVNALLDTLSPSRREIVERLYGLNGAEPQDAKAVAAAMGLSHAAVRQAHSRALAALQVKSELPASYRPRETKRERLRSTVGGNKLPESPRDFPVIVRPIREEVA